MKVLFGGDTFVRSTDLTCSADRVEVLLSERYLQSTDLVKIDGVWMTLADAPRFADAAAPHARREARVRFLRAALAATLVALLIVLIEFVPRAVVGR
ncbi:MAG: hypothetical protein JNM17_20685 [Archangium sp.]|nr:hypothetical protein [Archangium sp.]